MFIINQLINALLFLLVVSLACLGEYLQGAWTPTIYSFASLAIGTVCFVKFLDRYRAGVMRMMVINLINNKKGE